MIFDCRGRLLAICFRSQHDMVRLDKTFRAHTKYERFEVCNYDGTILRSNEISLPKKNMLDLLLYKTYFIGQ